MTVGAIIAIIVSILASIGLSFGIGRKTGMDKITRSEGNRRNEIRNETEVVKNEIDNDIDSARRAADDTARISDIARKVIEQYDKAHRK